MPVGRPPRHGSPMTSAERNAKRRGKLMAVVEAAEFWRDRWRNLAHSVRGVGFDVAQSEFDIASVRLDVAVSDWREYRGKRRV